MDSAGTQDNRQGSSAGAGEAPHKRRVHYSGKYPKKFEEKYKEHDPEKYRDEIEHVISKGSTPAGMHIPIMPDEILDVLKIEPGMSGCDCTFGYGGHSSKMLAKLEGEGHLVSLDIDPIESVKSEERLRKMGFGPDLFDVMHINFADVDEAAAKFGPFDFLLADLGVSSMQIDDPERGFSYKLDGPLDMRMNPEAGVPASERLKELNEEELISLFIDNSDEPYAEEIAEQIVKHLWRKKTLETTGQLREVIGEALSFLPSSQRDEAVKKSCARVFQALRIDVNSEMESLLSLMEKLPTVMKPGGRIAVLTFHSGEDRIVKKMFQEYKRDGVFADISRDVIRPSKEECFRNPRARSTKLRWAVR